MRYGSGISYAMYKNRLSAFAQQSGGIAVFPRFEGELPDIFSGVANFLRNEYVLTFRSSVGPRDGEYHSLKIELVGADGKPLKVKNHEGKLRKVYVYARSGYVALAYRALPARAKDCN